MAKTTASDPTAPLINAAPRLRILIAEMTAIGPGRADLLEAIERTGSITRAAQEMKMSYRRAWVLVESTNAAFVEPLIEANTGGKGGGGARLTAFGHTVLGRYREMERKAAAALESDFAVFSKLLKPLEQQAGADAPTRAAPLP